MNTPETSVFESFLSESVSRRRQLLPWWMRFFCWAFMGLAILSLLCLLIGIFGMNVKLAIFGIESSVPLSTGTLFIAAIFLLKGLVGWSLWFEKDYAVVLGSADAIGTITICIITMIAGNEFEPMMNINSNFRIELVFLVPYLIKLLMIRSEWNARK